MMMMMADDDDDDGESADDESHALDRPRVRGPAMCVHGTVGLPRLFTYRGFACAVAGRKEMLEMLEFCARHKIGASIVKRPMAEVNEAVADLHEKNVPYRFVLTNEEVAA